MAERTTHRDADDTDADRSESSVGGSLDGSAASAPTAKTKDLRSRATDRSSDAVRGLVVALVGVALLWVIATAVLPGGALAGFVGLLAGGFAFGLLGRRRYVALGLAGGAVGAGAALLDFLTISLLGAAPLVVAAGAGGGLLATVLGHFLGRDLRDGLTRDL